MATAITISTFDFTFDHTFGLKVTPVTPATLACRMPGVLLNWESPTGFCGWLFAGNIDKDKNPSAVGPYQQAGVDRDSLRISQPQMTIRAGSLNEADSEIVSTLFESVRVWAIMPDRNGKDVPVRVYVEPVVVPVWRDAESRAKLEARIRFPYRKSQRG